MFVHPDFKLKSSEISIVYHLLLTNWTNKDSKLDQAINFKPFDLKNIQEYRKLWWTVGGSWNWNGRIESTDQEIKDVLNNENYYASQIIIDGKPIGLLEYSIIDGIAEIVYFGLIPEMIGKGYGSQLFNFMINDCISKGSSKIWLHTCSLDSPEALPFYQRKGFTLFKITRQNENLYELK